MSASIGQEFIEKTKPKYAGPSRQSQGLPQPPLELGYPSDGILIRLPAHDQAPTPEMDLRRAMEVRKTIRQYSPQPLSLEELSYLLWVTQGVRRITTRPSTARNVPSAGARHAFETYVLINRVDGLEPGLYRYIATQHALLLADGSLDINVRLTEACAHQEHVGNSAVTFFWVAVLERMYWRYGERGYRYLFLDAGHVCQNLYLAAEAIDSGVCAIGAYDDDALNAALGVDGENQFTVYAATLGKRAPRE
ncbi:protein containg SagB-type dehydrogenase domain [Longilinea arvoryzae]|uniref:Protein containg SagB-type dehydrogenase domain n=1 Tax=Longilinea arvoryzae TaxID=360412 RepID=A0A0S7B7X9_9CHLR|nr:SagB/ThcOx family dehydrogenase [Longilinea arvoryzae]GAP13399.1 protein containg SagB-type dehydrogenase domain [Longilinea arvoryzae]